MEKKKSGIFINGYNFGNVGNGNIIIGGDYVSIEDNKISIKDFKEK